MGRLNNGFTFFNDRNYSTRIVVKDRAIQGVELYIHDYDKYETLELNIPVISEDKFSKIGKIESLIESFEIPDKLPKEETGNQDQN